MIDPQTIFNHKSPNPSHHVATALNVQGPGPTPMRSALAPFGRARVSQAAGARGAWFEVLGIGLRVWGWV